MSRRPRSLRARRPWARLVQSSAFVRKELAEIVRQPRLLALLVAGPFVLLLLFGAGYRSDDLRLRTLFVGPGGSFYEEAIARYEDELEAYIRPAGFTADLAAAERRLDDGDIDAVVVFPDDPLASLTAGEQAPIRIIHDKIDPIRQSAVEIAARLAVQEVNAEAVTTVLGASQAALRPVEDAVVAMTDAGGELAAAAAAGDATRLTDAAGTISAAAAEAHAVVAATEGVLGRLGAAADAARQEALTTLEAVRADADAIATGAPGDVAARTDELAGRLDQVADLVPQVTTIDPGVLARPFESRTETTVPERIQPIEFFAPSALALLLQHLAVTFAALSLVRDRSLGLFELLRVGPLSSWEIIAGKTTAYLIVGLVVGASLLAAAVGLLSVPLHGEVLWAVVAFALVLLASLAIGTLVSLSSGTETQAVQWAMLSLLAGLFFGGFVISLETMTFPVKAISYLLPVTYGIRILQDVMLRGADAAWVDLVGLGALVVGYGAISVWVLRRQLRTG